MSIELSSERVQSVYFARQQLRIRIDCSEAIVTESEMMKVKSGRWV